MRDSCSAGMPDPVSATSTTAPPRSARVTIVTHPPFGIASRAFRHGLRKTCCSLCSIPCTSGATAASSFRTWMLPVRNWCSPSDSTSLTTELLSHGPPSTSAGRAWFAERCGPRIDRQQPWGLVPGRDGDGVVGRPFGGGGRRTSDHPHHAAVEQLVERETDRGLVSHVVELFHLAVPSGHAAVPIE